MQDQDNIAQTDEENNEIKETARENADVLSIPPAFENVKDPVAENYANENVLPQNAQEIPSVEYIGEPESGEIPTAAFNYQDVPENPSENDGSQTVQTPKDEEPFIFNGYEIKTWQFNPRIYKILTGSTIFCMLALVAIAQSNVLNTRACDSPLVSKVCQVLDTVYVGSVLLGTDSEWVDQDYERTDLGNMDITYIDTSNVSPPLPYPQGYFAAANPEMMYNDPLIIPGSEFPTADGFPPPTNFPPPSNFPTTPNPTTPNPIAPGINPIAKPPVYPKPNKNNPTGNLPDSGVVVEGDDPNEKKPRDKNQGFETGGDEKTETANNKQPDIKSDPADGEVELNRKPLTDLGAFVEDKVKKGEVDLNTPFTVQATGKLDKDGKIKAGTFKVVKAQSSDEDMIAVVQRSIEAIDESGYLKYLEKLSGKDLSLLFAQDNEKIVAEVQSELESDSRARSIQSGLNFVIGFTIDKKKKDILQKTEELKTVSAGDRPELERRLQNVKDDLELLNNATVTTDGKKIIIKFNIRKDIAHPMIQRKLLSPRTDENKPKSNSAAKTENDRSNAGK